MIGDSNQLQEGEMCMEIEKLKKWLDKTQKVQLDSFWKTVFHSRKSSQEDAHSEKEEKMNYNLYQLNGFLVLELELPGMDKNEFQMWMDHQNLLIKAKTAAPLKKKTEPVYFVKKRRVIPSEHHIPLPVPVFTQPVKISQKNGLWHFLFKPILKSPKTNNALATDEKTNR
jgi:HSP20 family molecular chaperone IbpA